jgi:hypothetical protein
MKRIANFYFLCVFLLISGCASNTVELVDLGPPVSYQTDIKPILVTHCYKCHTDTATHPDKPGYAFWNDFSELQTYALATSTANPAYTKIQARLRHIEIPGMPYDQAQPLPDSLIVKIERWIKQGAPNN